ncbi:MAG: hypothetical protein M1438_06850 [Deltaproteobacteria bacterium]|nr:hypothetical protein [Deltaproteobacteria bacterium]
MALMISGVILLLGALPVWATVPGDVAAGLPADKIVANGLGAGMALEAIMTQALDAGAKAEAVFKAGIAQGADLSSLFKLFMDKLKYDPNFRGQCTICDLMKWAKEAGKDPVEIANAVMAAGGDLNDVRNCLASMGVPGAETYAYSPPGPPGGPSGVGPTFPGSGGGGGVASPSM